MTGGQKAAKGFGMVLACLIVMSIVGGIITGLSFAGRRFGFIKTDGESSFVSTTVDEDDYYKEFGEVEDLYVGCGAFRVEVRAGDVNSVTLHNVSDRYEIGYTDGILSVKAKGSSDFFDWVFDDAWVDDQYAIVTVKRDKLLDSVTIDGGSGHIILGSFQTKSFVLDGGSGYTEANDLTTGTAYLDLGSGGAAFKRFKGMDLVSNSGSGSVSFDDSEVSDARVDSSSGSFRFAGKLLKSLDIDSGSGSASIELVGNMDEYNLRCDSGSGGIYINGDKRDSVTISGTDPEKRITVDGGSGRVSIDFNR